MIELWRALLFLGVCFVIVGIASVAVFADRPTPSSGDSEVVGCGCGMLIAGATVLVLGAVAWGTTYLRLVE